MNNIENGKISVTNLLSISKEEMHESSWISVAMMAYKSGYTVQAIYQWIRQNKIEARVYSGRIVVRVQPLPPR